MDYELFIKTKLERNRIVDLLYELADDVLGVEVKFKKNATWSCQEKCSLKTPSYRNPVTKQLVNTSSDDK
ncbi:hypothetical protein PCURB6_34020 [Paenibacillus curdlanolyticus]|nr:hypothetical protein [Paenibacillus curdlanolyticus]GFN33142.1 hypothetical protein PCURB6_34020 [Paenibacillus curdlanolyticus]